MAEAKHSRSEKDCEEAGLLTVALTAEYSEAQAAAFRAGVMARVESKPGAETHMPEDIELRVPYQRGYAYADANSGDYQGNVYGQQPRERETVPAPPGGLHIDQAQQGGSTRGNEENTNPHPNAKDTDRDLPEGHKSKPEHQSAGRQHPGSRGDAQATDAEREEAGKTSGDSHRRAGEPGRKAGK